MKILILSAANNVHTMRWANAMSERGHNVTVVSCRDHKPDSKVQYDSDVKILLLKFSSGLGYYLNARELKKIAKKQRFDVINVHYASGYGTLGRMANLKNALLNIWGSDVYVYPYKKKFNEKIIKKNLSFYNYVASTSRCMAEQARKFVDRNYYITPFGVDVLLFKPINGLKDPDKFTIGTVKSLSPIYGISDSIKAFGLVIKRLKAEGEIERVNRLRYEIYGRGEQQPELQQLINDLDLSDKVKLCGYVENNKLPEIYNRFDLFVCNSLSESFGVAAVEAMACGVPVVTSAADGFKEVVADGVTGLIVPIGDLTAISDCVYKLIKNEPLRCKMGAAGVERVKTLYSWKDNVDVMENLYRRVDSGDYWK